MRFAIFLTLLTTLSAQSQPQREAFRATFEPNVGQVARTVEWVVRSGAGAPMFLRTGGAAMAVSATASSTYVVMRFEGARETAASVGEEPLASYSNYYLGRDERSWFTGVSHFARIRYREIYPGIDIVYRAAGRGVEYDFELRSGADPSQIRITSIMRIAFARCRQAISC
jgi:hypothetical protein